MEDLFSKDQNLIVKTCIEIYKNPENYRKNKKKIIIRLLELPDYRIDYRFPYYPEYCNAGSLKNIILMALISLYKLEPESEDLTPNQILEYFSNDSYLSYKDVFSFPEFKNQIISFITEDLRNNYSKKTLFLVIERFNPLFSHLGRSSRRAKSGDIISIYLDLLEIWLSDPLINREIYNEYMYLVPILKNFETIIKEKFTSILIKLIKMKKYEILSFYSLIEEHIVNEDLKAEFKKNIPDSKIVPGIENFIKAEEFLSKKKFQEAHDAYNKVPNDFPKIEGMIWEKLYLIAKELNDYPLMGTYLRNLIKIQESFIKYASDNFYDRVLKNIIKMYLDDLSNSSDYILMENGIPCKFCSIYISPNAQFCPKCGEPNN